MGNGTATWEVLVGSILFLFPMKVAECTAQTELLHQSTYNHGHVCHSK